MGFGNSFSGVKLRYCLIGVLLEEYNEVPVPSLAQNNGVMI